MSAETREAKLIALYSELNKWKQNGDYERGLRAANNILKHFSQEVLAFHCKVVCLMQLGKFQEALQAINKSTKLSENLKFEKAYALYRLNKTAEALEVINSAPEPLTLKLKELKAQILYRLEMYDESFLLYQDLIKNSDDDFGEERLTNLAGVMGCLELEDKTRTDLQSLSEDTYEQTYNAACRLIAVGRYKEAEEKLKTAEKLCKETLEEDELSEEEIQAELAIIKVQLAYCIQEQSPEREKEAMSIYSSVLKQRPDDIALVAVASNNILTLNRDTNVFDSRKKIKAATAEGLENKLTSLQRRDISFNQCLLSMYTGQGELCRQLASELRKSHKELDLELTLLESSQLMREKKLNQAVEHLKEKNFGATLAPDFAVAQLLLSENRTADAAEVLDKLCRRLYQLGLISVLVNLYKQQEDVSKATQLLNDSVAFHKKQKKKSSELGSLWQHCSQFYLGNKQYRNATDCLKQLLEVDPNNTRVRAQLICALAEYSPEEAKKQSSYLPDDSEMGIMGDVDVETLVSSNWVLGAKQLKKATKDPGVTTPRSPASGNKGESELILKKKKKKKKIRLPKNYDPNVPPDPERWLPRRERSNYRKKRDRRHQGGVGKGTQGATSQQQDMYDITKKAQSPKTNATTSSGHVQEQTPGPRQQRGGGGAKKKKGRKH